MLFRSDSIPFVKFFITGRPEPRIRSGFRLKSLRPHTEVLKLHGVKAELVDRDIRLFLKTQLTDIVENRSHCNYPEDWPSSGDIDILCKKAAGFFIFASTVVKFIASKHYPPDERLALITSLPQDTSYEGGLGVDLLYAQVLEQAFHTVDEGFYSHLKSVVGTVILIFNPLSINTLSCLHGNCGSPSRIYNTLRALHSLLLIPDSMEDPVRIFHKSFPDFLTDPERCKAEKFFINPSVHHQEILLSCLSLMKGRLKKNICNLDDHASLDTVEDLPSRSKAQIGDALGYACQFWAKHLLEVSSHGHGVEEVHGAINEFFPTCFLLWIEVLSLMKILDVGVYALKNIQQWYKLVSCIHSIHFGKPCSCLFRQKFPASG